MALLAGEIPGARQSPPLVLLGGWGHRAPVWHDLAVLAERRFEVRVVDLPGYDGAARAIDERYVEEQLVESLAQAIPLHSIVCGWSLGGMLATRLAEKYPERVSTLVTLCSNPRFVAAADWPLAMPAQTFSGFARRLASDPVATLVQFQGLAASGSHSSKRDLRRLRELLSKSPLPPQNALVASLDCLASLDVRSAIAALRQPQLHVLGRADALVPAAVGAKISALHAAARVEVLTEVAHLPMLTCPERVLALLQEIANCGARSDVASAG